MPRCQALKSDGSQCNGTAKVGYKWCAYHRKKFASKVKHGKYADPSTLAIPEQEQLTFQQFYEREKPFDLLSELAYARTLLVEQRKAIEARNPQLREALLKDFKSQSFDDLIQKGLDEKIASSILEIITIRLEEVLNEYYGKSMPMNSREYAALGNSLERVAKIAEKAKKIAEGITLNINFSNVGLVLIKFVREVIMAEIKDPHIRARIVERVRAMNLTRALEANNQ
ncbi:MAG: hypothetical protein D6752_02420 [Candidatus Nitrosothermus koennekii]|nr:MAG: hypothetical protein D6752_02420 [Candidatus Nitrosothermus koennekii]